jgi:hypothetical protein
MYGRAIFYNYMILMINMIFHGFSCSAGACRA